MKKILLVIFFVFNIVHDVVVSAVATTKSDSKNKAVGIPRRERNLDHWDAKTLAYYLGLDHITGKSINDDHTYVGIDGAVMFYARWCTNCHSFAPIWDAIATLLKAGTTDGNIIVALFDCEYNDVHVKLCDSIGITHYPTVMHIGAGPYPVSSSKKKPYGKDKIARTVKFQSNFAIGDAVYDWVKAMKFMSSWYQWNYMNGGILKRLRSILTVNPFQFVLKRRNKNKDTATASVGSIALPVGIPTIGNTVGSSSSSSSATTTTGGQSTKSTSLLEKELKLKEDTVLALEKKLKERALANSHAGIVINGFLFPITVDENNTDTTANSSNSTSSDVDLFTVMTEQKAWNKSVDPLYNTTDPVTKEEKDVLILKSCFIDLTLDYCTRLTTKVTKDYLHKLDSEQQQNTTLQYPSFLEMETEIQTIISNKEPYCSIFSDCYKEDFQTDKCCPNSCPFVYNGNDGASDTGNNIGACKYVAICVTKAIQEEYESIIQEMSTASTSTSADDALPGGSDGNIVVEEESTTMDESSSSTEEKKKASSGGGGGLWGMKK